MKNAMIYLVLATIALMTSGCYTSYAVQEKRYYALPVTVPVDAALLPAQVGGACLLYALIGHIDG